MFNIKLIVQYKGTRYYGWQEQRDGLTVQQTLTQSIETITGEKVSLTGSGRTDTGVHALGQAANFRIKSLPDLHKFRYSLNSVLPPDISVIEAEEVSLNFHARFDAKSRRYFYLFVKYKSPFYEPFAYRYHYKLDSIYLNRLSKLLIGKKDFTSFAKKSTGPEEKTCTVYDAAWRETKGFVIFFIEADRFLHGMVRTIAGTLLKAQKNHLDENYIEEVFQSRKRESAGEAVPAKGLFLYKVKY